MVRGPAHVDIPKLAASICSEVMLFISHKQPKMCLYM